MLRTVGLLRPGAENLVPYAMKLYAQSGKPGATEADEKQFWKVRDDFNAQFGNPEFPNRFAPQIRFLGLWDTVKSVGWLNARARFEQARWPFTRIVTNVETGRLALAVDEDRRPYHEYRFDADEVARRPGRLEEMWFAGVHSDVGGQFPDDHDLSDIALGWMADQARAAGLRVERLAPTRSWSACLRTRRCRRPRRWAGSTATPGGGLSPARDGTTARSGPGTGCIPRSCSASPRPLVTRTLTGQSFGSTDDHRRVHRGGRVLPGARPHPQPAPRHRPGPHGARRGRSHPHRVRATCRGSASSRDRAVHASTSSTST